MTPCSLLGSCQCLRGTYFSDFHCIWSQNACMESWNWPPRFDKEMTKIKTLLYSHFVFIHDVTLDHESHYMLPEIRSIAFFHLRCHSWHPLLDRNWQNMKLIFFSPLVDLYSIIMGRANTRNAKANFTSMLKELLWSHELYFSLRTIFFNPK